ncbi:TetR/AcrR family transcriptional regulator [Ornithinibacillus scapharcae]|uniref:TetR/AcrR family transcriptional regulator n=1 Tax=Ornithinibacillus scapharcae TaxID=1147159 RepID=UPI000225B60A|nr:TetR/AcrR family transcriptional regulator [Ornithinibacillus scapharcae]
MEQLDKEWIKDVMDISEKELTPKQAKIVEAAIEIFSEKGFAATSTSEIAKQAGVAEGTIFRHYKTKKDLLISIVMPVISKFAVPFLAEKFLLEVFGDEEFENFDALLRKLIYNRYEFVKKNVQLLKILIQEMAYHSEIQESFKNVFVNISLPKFQSAIKMLREKDQLVDFPTETMLRLAVTTIVGFLITRFIIMPDYDWEDEKEIEYTIQFIRNGLKDIK